jgi:uncharacterized membrane protein
MSSTSIGLTIIIVGLAIVAIGILVAIGALSWFGRLPGDIRIEGDSVRVFVPITSMLLISVILTLAVNILRRLLR